MYSLDAYLDFYDQKLSKHEEIDIKFRIYSGVTLKYGAKMRANNKFHKRPIFSNIAVEMNPDEIFEYTSDNDLKSFSNGFLHLTLLTALEYRSLMKIMIFIVDNLYQDSKRPNFIKNNKITEIYLKWNKMYLLSRKENYEESDITCLQVFHICSSIREFGAINGYTTETYESLHKDYVKKPYKLTNKKEIEKQIMKIITIIIESSSKEIPKTPIALKYSKKLYEFCIQNAEIYIQTRMNDLDLEKEMKLGFEKFLKCLDYTCRQNY
ncbi:hypothetical protein Glove_140g176 [Diversispora epigaea]|uniref:Uncharacterized protein n=1 Tax=Diversispora epigaea TaxID=1348612 RepID=A0A397J3W8_9GLOM|nr:hypothetical protein Glove_140g176 [Diversispora epigaea]